MWLIEQHDNRQPDDASRCEHRRVGAFYDVLESIDDRVYVLDPRPNAKITAFDFTHVGSPGTELEFAL